jgi:hypothetical protein
MAADSNPREVARDAVIQAARELAGILPLHSLSLRIYEAQGRVFPAEVSIRRIRDGVDADPELPPRMAQWAREAGDGLG